MEFSKDLELAKEIIYKAGEIVKNGYENYLRIETKSNNKDIVTNIDKESEKIITDFLLEKTDYSILGEEFGKNQRNKDFFWVIDPLDGTTNFSRGIPVFSLSIGLLKNNTPILGAILNPITNELFFAEKNKGAYLNNKKIFVSKKKSLEDLVLFMEYGYDEKHREICIEKMKELEKYSIRSLGSTALGLAYVAKGSADALFDAGDKLWDFVAGMILIKEAGGKITDWKGEKIKENVEFVLASNGLIHNDILAVLGKSRV